MMRLTQALHKGRNFAKRANVSYSTIHNYLTGTNTPNLETLVKLAEATGKSVQWLATGEELNENWQPAIYDSAGNVIDIAEFCFIPRYNVYASVGHGSDISDETYMFSIAYRAYWVRKYLNADPKNLIALTVRGDSMEGVIDERDVIIVDRSLTTLADGIYVLRLEGTLLVKRVQRLLNGIIKITSENPAYDPIEININKLPSDLAVIGCVVHVEPGIPFKFKKRLNTN